MKYELLRIEHDSIARQIFARELRGFIVLGCDRDLKRFFAGEAKFILPRELELLSIVDRELLRLRMLHRTAGIRRHWRVQTEASRLAVGSRTTRGSP